MKIIDRLLVLILGYIVLTSIDSTVLKVFSGLAVLYALFIIILNGIQDELDN